MNILLWHFPPAGSADWLGSLEGRRPNHHPAEDMLHCQYSPEPPRHVVLIASLYPPLNMYPYCGCGTLLMFAVVRYGNTVHTYTDGSAELLSVLSEIG